MADSFSYPFIRSNNYLGAYRLLPSTKDALPILEDMQFEASGPAAAVFSGNAPIIWSQSAALVSNSALAGNAPIVWSQQAALLSGTILSGTTSIDFAQSAAFGASASFSGAASVDFSQSGAFKANSAFSGTADVEFTQTGTFTAGGGAGANFSGTADVSFTASAAFNASGALSGATTIDLALTGSFVAAGSQEQDYGFYSPFKRPQKRRIEDDEEDKQPVEVVLVGDAPKRQVLTGIVAPARKAKAIKPEQINKLSQARVEGERIKADRIRRNIAASNAWLMTA